MLFIFRSAENLTAVPESFSLNKDYETERDLKVKQGLLTSIAVKNTTLFHPDSSFSF